MMQLLIGAMLGFLVMFSYKDKGLSVVSFVPLLVGLLVLYIFDIISKGALYIGIGFSIGCILQYCMIRMRQVK